MSITRKEKGDLVYMVMNKYIQEDEINQIGPITCIRMSH